MNNQLTDFSGHLSSIWPSTEMENINLSDLNIFGSELPDIDADDKIIGEMLLHERKLFYLSAMKAREFSEFMEDHMQKTPAYNHNKCNEGCINLKKIEIQCFTLKFLCWNLIRQRIPNFYTLGPAKGFKIVTPVNVSDTGFPTLEEKDKLWITWYSIHGMPGVCERIWNKINDNKVLANALKMET